MIAEAARLPPISAENPVARRAIIHTLFLWRPYCREVNHAEQIHRTSHRRRDCKAWSGSVNEREKRLIRFVVEYLIGLQSRGFVVAFLSTINTEAFYWIFVFCREPFEPLMRIAKSCRQRGTSGAERERRGWRLKGEQIIKRLERP